MLPVGFTVYAMILIKALLISILRKYLPSPGVPLSSQPKGNLKKIQLYFATNNDFKETDDDVQTHPIIPAIEKSYQSALLLEAEVKHGCH